MAKKYTNLYYKFSDPLLDKKDTKEKGFISNFIEEGTLGSSCWFKNLKSNTSESTYGKYIPNVMKYITLLHNKCLRGDTDSCDIVLNSVLSTVKTCPGIRRVIKNSIIVKSPCDIAIDIDSAGEWMWKTPDLRGLIELAEDHGPVQFGDPWTQPGSELFKNKRVIKFKFPLILHTDGEPFIFLQPQFHTDFPLEIVNGVIAPPSPNTFLNIVTFYELPEEGDTLSIHIKKGDVLCYLWGAKPFKLKKNKKGLEDTPFMTKFLGNYKEDR
jgi:hypothetical protein